MSGVLRYTDLKKGAYYDVRFSLDSPSTHFIVQALNSHHVKVLFHNGRHKIDGREGDIHGAEYVKEISQTEAINNQRLKNLLGRE